MARVLGAEGLVEIDTPSGYRRHRDKDGTFHLNQRDANALKAIGGYIVPDMGPAVKRSEGYRCESCGFGSWFKKCSQCGADCVKET